MLASHPLVAVPIVPGPPGHGQLGIVFDLGEELRGAATSQLRRHPAVVRDEHAAVGAADVLESLRRTTHALDASPPDMTTRARRGCGGPSSQKGIC